MPKNNNQSDSLSNIEFVQDIAHETAANYSGGAGYLYGDDPDVILYTEPDRKGAALNINAAVADGIPNVGDDFNDKISSIEIKRGEWTFFKHSQYGEQIVDLLKPGVYNLTVSDNEITSAFRVN